MGERKMITDYIQQVVANVEKVIVGKNDLIRLLLVAMVCEGHVLIEDVPGLGKTMLARSVAISIGGDFKRIQCTPDLLPNDMTGVSVFNQLTTQFEFRPGPVFVNVLLADEINRATPRTQSALLEAMQEAQVTVDGITHPLPRPFLVIATQNPIEFEGTFPLPEAQLDRFLMQLSLGYPSKAEERRILALLRKEHPILGLQPVVEASGLLTIQNSIWEVHVEESIQDYILDLVRATREHPDLALGSSPRGSLALFKTSQAYAAFEGRDYVLPDDVQRLAPYVLPHRLILKPEAEIRGRTRAGVIADIVANTRLDINPYER
jgi:MoxR-like ATPase